jgi:hypothetical protein
MEARRREAFLRALEATGNQTLAAERACVSRSWVCKERGLSAEFDSACRAAISRAERRLDEAEGRGAGRGWDWFEGHELIVRGTGGGRGTRGRRRRVQIARARPRQWTPRTEDRFLQALASLCNVRGAAKAVGLTFGSAYAHRNRWPGFRARWEAVEQETSVRLDGALMAAAQNLFSAQDLPEWTPIRRMSVVEAIHYLNMRERVAGLGRLPWSTAADEEEAEWREAVRERIAELRARRAVRMRIRELRARRAERMAGRGGERRFG